MEGAIRLSCVGNDLYQEIKSKNYLPFCIIEKTNVDELTFEIYENEEKKNKWRAVEENPIFSPIQRIYKRSRFTDDNGDNMMRSLADFQPIAGYKWKNDWEVVVELGKTDEAGYSYALNWSR